MYSLLQERRTAIFSSVVIAAIVVCSILIAQSTIVSAYPALATAITIDLVFSLPLAYAFLIRKTSIPKTTIVPVFILATVLAWSILPADNRYLLDFITTYFLPVLEIGALLYIGAIIVRTAKTYRFFENTGSDLPERLRSAFVAEMPFAAAARVAAFELSVIYYAFFRWRKKATESCFSYRTGPVSLSIVFIFLLSAETVVLHLVVSRWSLIAAWILTALSVYACFQLFAHLKAIIFRPMAISDDSLFIRCGIIGDAAFKLDEIEKIEIVNSSAADDRKAATLTPLGRLTQPNVLIQTNSEQTINGIYGIRKKFADLLIYVDDPTSFAAEVQLAKLNAGHLK